MVKVYLDNVIVSAKSRRDVDQAECKAIDSIYAASCYGSIVIGTSRQSTREMERAPSEYQSSLKSGFSGLAFAKDDHKVLGMYFQSDPYGGCIASPLVTDIVDEKLFLGLLADGLKCGDAKHVMYAALNGFDRFVTLDNGILNRKVTLEARCRLIQFVRPTELVAELAKAKSPDNNPADEP